MGLSGYESNWEKSAESPSKKTCKQDHTKDQGKCGDEEEMVESTVTDKVDAISVENGTTFNVCNFNVNDYRQKYFFVKIEQIEDPNVMLRDGCLHHVTSLSASLPMYGFDHSRGTLYVTFQLGLNT